MLDEFQLEAVKERDGSTLVVAGPGAGKTRTLLAKAEQCEQPLVLTFTNRAAKEAHGMTFHSFCHSLVGGEIWNRQDCLYIMSKICREMGVKDSRVAINELKEISWRKCRGMKVADTPWYAEYERRKGNALDFGDLLIKGLDYVSNMDISNRYGTILVDEFQDLNPLQFAILNQISNNNVFAVGDPYQSIYTWRDAYPEIFDDFRKRYHPTEKPLMNDWRHGPEIMACLEWLFPRGLIPKGPPGRVEMFECMNSETEIAVVKKLVKEMGDVDILCRYWALLRNLVHNVEGVLVSDPENEDYFPTTPEDGSENVRLRSIHASKGGTFDTDILVGLTEGVWPQKRVADYDEEYRLLYVAMSRAKYNLFITTGGSTSHFLGARVNGRGVIPCPTRVLYKNGTNIEEVKNG